MVWDRVGIITGYKYNLLKQDKQEKRKEEEKGDLNFVDNNIGTPSFKMSANKDKRSNFKDDTMDNEQAEGYNEAGNKNIAKPSDIVDSSQGRKKGGDVTERGKDDVVSR